MNLYQLQEALSKKYADKSVTLRFTDACRHSYDIQIREGKPKIMGHCTYNKVQVEPEGEEAYLVEITHHRQALPFSEYKVLLSAFTEPYIGEADLKGIADMEEEFHGKALDRLAADTGIARAEIQSRFDAVKNVPQQEEKVIPVIMP